MADKPRQDAKRRASFARAERMRRTGDGIKASKTRQKTAKSGHAKPARTRQGDRPKPRRLSPLRSAFAAASRPARARAAPRAPTSFDTVSKRVEATRRASEQRRHQRARDEFRRSFTRQAERRKDFQQRGEFTRRREAAQATVKRAQDLRRRDEQRRQQKRQQQSRQTFNRQAGVERARQLEAKRAAQMKDAQRRAAVEVSREQKARQADQQAQHRRETEQTRLRHQSATRSMQMNQQTAEDRHWHAVRRVDASEQRELAAFDAQRGRLHNRIAEAITGKDKADEQRQAIQQRHEADRMAKHRELETLKERQFDAAQTMRLQQARERLQLMQEHRADRQQMQQQHEQDRPRQVEDRQRAIVEAERENPRDLTQVWERQAEDRSWFSAGAGLNLTLRR